MGKIQWNIITVKRRFLQPPKHGRYYWYRYTHVKRVCKDFGIEKLDEYADLYVQSNTLLLGGVFYNFWSTCFETNMFDLAHFLLVLRLAWQAVLKRIY